MPRRCHSRCTTWPRIRSERRRSRASGARDAPSAAARAHRRSDSAQGAQTVTSGCSPRCAIRDSSVGRPQHQQTPVAGCEAVEVDMESFWARSTEPSRRTSARWLSRCSRPSGNSSRWAGLPAASGVRRRAFRDDLADVAVSAGRRVQVGASLDQPVERRLESSELLLTLAHFGELVGE